MRKKVRAIKFSLGVAQGKANRDKKAVDHVALKVKKQIWRPNETPTGRGLGKAGARRLGQLLKRAIQDQESSSVSGKVSLPKTPVRLFKHQIQAEATNAPETSKAPEASAAAEPAPPQVSKLILSVVSQCKHKGGISMAELKETLSAEGYNVTKNSKRVNVATKRLVDNETLVRTTRNASYKLNMSKMQTDAKQGRPSSVKPPTPKQEQQKQSPTPSQTPDKTTCTAAPSTTLPETPSKTLPETSNKTQSETPKQTSSETPNKIRPKTPGKELSKTQSKTASKEPGKTQSPKAEKKPAGQTGKSPKAKAKPTKVQGKAPRVAVKSRKTAAKARTPAAGGSHKPKRQTATQARGKSTKPAGGKNRRPTKKQATTRVRKAPRRALSRRPRQNRLPQKSKRKEPRRRRPTKPKGKSQQRRVPKTVYYYKIST